MLLRISKEKGKLNILSERFNLTEIDLDTSNYCYFIDSNVVDRETFIEKITTSEKILSYNTINTLFNGNFFVVCYNKLEGTLNIYRDKSGIKTGYYHVSENDITIGTNVHDLARESKVKSFDRDSINKLFYVDFLLDGHTVYKDVFEFKRGGEYSINLKLQLKKEAIHKIELPLEENKLSEDQNISVLRDEIKKAHKGYLCEKNKVLLSGGIDSVAMLVGLDDLVEKNKINAISYKVKNTIEDETHYAKSIADHLSIPIEINEIDPANENNFENFEQKILKMNNPYIGMWIFGNFKGTLNEIFYAGQDTRLHTPSVNPIDKLMFSVLPFKNNGLVKVLDLLFNIIRFFVGLVNYKRNRYLRWFYRMTHIFSIESYVNKYYFKLDEEKVASYNFLEETHLQLKEYFKIDYSSIKTPRQLYNKIVELKWDEQYVNDIRYLQDIAKLNDTYIALPFYLEEIVKFSASIPFKLSIKNMVGRGKFNSKKQIVNKYILRQALRDKINDKVYYRAKAVSLTMYLLFNGVLGRLVKKEIVEDLDRENSFIRKYNFNLFVQKFVENDKWSVSDEEYLLKIYYLCTLCIYNKKVLA